MDRHSALAMEIYGVDKAAQWKRKVSRKRRRRGNPQTLNLSACARVRMYAQANFNFRPHTIRTIPDHIYGGRKSLCLDNRRRHKTAPQKMDRNGWLRSCPRSKYSNRLQSLTCSFTMTKQNRSLRGSYCAWHSRTQERRGTNYERLKSYVMALISISSKFLSLETFQTLLTPILIWNFVPSIWINTIKAFGPLFLFITLYAIRE